MKLDKDDYYELLREARYQVDRKYKRGTRQVNLLRKMSPSQWQSWHMHHWIMFELESELD